MLMHDPSWTLRGAIPALVTPFQAGDGGVDHIMLGRLAERAVGRGASGVVVCGSTGEAAALTAEEQARVIHAVHEAVGGKVPVIAGINAACTHTATSMAATAERCGASALLCAAPPYVKPSQEGMSAHLRAVSAACSLPVILYDVPSRVGVGFDDETVASLFEDGIIVGLKDATGDLSRPANLRRLCGAGLQQLSGDDATALAHLAMGGVGCISVTANIVPALCSQLQQAWQNRDIAGAAELSDWLHPLHQALFSETNPVPVKGALHLLGLCDPAPRLPLVKASSKVMSSLEEALGRLIPLERSFACSKTPRIYRPDLSAQTAPHIRLPSGTLSARDLDEIPYR